MHDAKRLRELADQCRCLAAATQTKDAHHALLLMAKRYEQQAEDEEAQLTRH
jgi:CRP-like cAMP-binding protein